MIILTVITLIALSLFATAVVLAAVRVSSDISRHEEERNR